MKIVASWKWHFIVIITSKRINGTNFTYVHSIDFSCEPSSVLQWRNETVLLHDYLLVTSPNWFHIIIVEELKYISQWAIHTHTNAYKTLTAKDN